MARNFILPERVIQDLEQHMAEEFCIKNCSYSVKIGSMNGDSYSSNIYRIVVTSQTTENSYENGTDGPASHAHTPQFILKMAPTVEVRRKMFSTVQQFAAEHHMYQVVLPALRSFQLQRLDEDDIFQNYPKMISACLEPCEEYILLEDVLPKGYENFYRPTPLGFDECAAIFMALARLHAVSFALRDQCPDEFTGLVENFREIVFPDPLTKELDDFLRLKIDCALTTLRESDEEVKERLLRLKDDIGESMKRCVSEKTYSAILHGDCWISNILCKRKANASVDSVAFVDWQISRNTTPIVDLSYLIFCSTDSKLRQSLPELLKIYYEALEARITVLGSDPAKVYPRDIFHEHVKEYMKFGLGMASMSLHTITCAPNDMPNVIDVLDTVTADFSILNDLSVSMSKKEPYRIRMADVCRDCVKFDYI